MGFSNASVAVGVQNEKTEVTVSADVNNYMSAQKQAVVIGVFYKNGKMAAYDIFKDDFAGNSADNKVLTFVFDEAVEQNDYIKLYIWDDVSGHVQYGTTLKIGYDEF